MKRQLNFCGGFSVRALVVGALALLASACSSASSPSSVTMAAVRANAGDGASYFRVEPRQRQTVRVGCTFRRPIAYSDEAGAFALFKNCPTGENFGTRTSIFLFYPEQRRTAELSTICPDHYRKDEFDPVAVSPRPEGLFLFDLNGGRFVYFCRPGYLEQESVSSYAGHRRFLRSYVFVNALDAENITQELRVLDADVESSSPSVDYRDVSPGGVAVVDQRYVGRLPGETENRFIRERVLLDLNEGTIFDARPEWSNYSWCDPVGGHVDTDGRDCAAFPVSFIGDTELLWACGFFLPSQGARRLPHGVPSRSPNDGAEGFYGVIDVSAPGAPLVERWTASTAECARKAYGTRQGWVAHRLLNESVVRVSHFPSGRELQFEAPRDFFPSGPDYVSHALFDRAARRVLLKRSDGLLLIYNLEHLDGYLAQSEAAAAHRGVSRAFHEIDRNNRVYAFGGRRIRYVVTIQ